MNNPIHEIKRWVTYIDGYKCQPHWTPDTVQGWLATGVKDKNGVEIYEGNIVQYFVHGEKVINTVKFTGEEFILANEKCDGLLSSFYGNELEVIGHIVEGKS